MESDNPSGADDQQETTTDFNIVLDPNWVVGFVDGEGCFCVSVHRSTAMKRHGGWQLQPTFQVYQHQDHVDVLRAMRGFFGYGSIRSKGPNSSVACFAVESLWHLEAAVVPFFEAHPLHVKQRDFLGFAEIVRSMRLKEHLSPVGFERLVRLAFGINANGKQRARTIEEILGGSSETGRGASRRRQAVAMKVQSDPHGDMGSWAEMTQPAPLSQTRGTGVE